MKWNGCIRTIVPAIFMSCIICLIANPPALSQNSIGLFSNHTDIGNPSIKGGAEYNTTAQQYELKGAGKNIWFNQDEFHYLYKKLKGDFILTADFKFKEKGVNANNHSKIGWMVRESGEDDAASVNATYHRDGLIVLQWRRSKGQMMRDPEDEIFYPKNGTQTIRLSRRDNLLSMQVANPGEPLQLVGSYEMTGLKEEVLAGLFICSHDSAVLEQATVWNVRIDKPVYYSYSPSPGAKNKTAGEIFGCRLEILDIENGYRNIIHEDSGRFEAPNWMRDGKHLLINKDGSLFTIPVSGGELKKLNTGSINRNNNDHVISFDGKMLGISSHRDGLPGGGSTVYTLPLTGGEPKLLTKETPSYLHGWSPDGKEVTIVAQRNGGKIYNIYKVSVETGKETNLTNNISGHVDGPEYSPDGKYIYYNSTQSGTMQVWRMKPDGSGKEQITFDQYHNWFPHISPDGRQMVFISFPPDIEPSSHPSYKEVMLRIMKLDRPSAPKVVAYLYGGQGTINVPSWSPDGKRLAFVSNSEEKK